jgi:hypothetical protein
MQCGNIRYKVSTKQLQNKIEKIVIFKNTFYSFVNTKEELLITDIYNDMVYNENRNNLIIEDVKNTVNNGRIPIILSEKIEHLNILKEKLSGLENPIITYKS